MLVKLIFISVVFFSCLSFTAQAQESCGWENLTFDVGEVVHYDIMYNWGIIWVQAASVTFKVMPVPEDKALMKFHSFGRTLKKWDWMYKVRDRFESVVRKSDFQVQSYEREGHEGKYFVHNQYFFDHEKKIINATVENSDKSAVTTQIPFENCTMDLMSMVYASRNIDYEQYQIGEKVPLSLIIDGVVHEKVYVEYLGKEVIEDRNDVEYECFKFQPHLVSGTIFDEDSDMTVWIKNDKNRVPIMVEAKILVGSVKAYFREAEGLKFNDQ